MDDCPTCNALFGMIAATACVIAVHLGQPLKFGILAFGDEEKSFGRAVASFSDIAADIGRSRRAHRQSRTSATGPQATVDASATGARSTTDSGHHGD